MSAPNNNNNSHHCFKTVLDECLLKAKQQADDDKPPCIPSADSDTESEEDVALHAAAPQLDISDDDVDDVVGKEHRQRASLNTNNRRPAENEAHTETNEQDSDDDQAQDDDKKAADDRNSQRQQQQANPQNQTDRDKPTPTPSVSSAAASLSSRFANSSNTNSHKYLQPGKLSSGSSASVRLMTAEEAFCEFMDLQQSDSMQKAFDSILTRCTEIVKRRIGDYSQTALCVFPSPLMARDSEYLVNVFTDELHYTVLSSSKSQLTLAWHNDNTKDLSVAQLKQCIKQLSHTNYTLQRLLPNIYTAYHACLYEKQRDQDWQENAKTQLISMIQVQISNETKVRKRSSFVFEVPAVKFLPGASVTAEHHSAKEHQLHLLLQVFNQVVRILESEPYNYEVSDVVATHSRMKFRLSFTGISDAPFAKSQTSAGLKSQKSRSTAAAAPAAAANHPKKSKRTAFKHHDQDLGDSGDQDQDQEQEQEQGLNNKKRDLDTSPHSLPSSSSSSRHSIFMYQSLSSPELMNLYTMLLQRYDLEYLKMQSKRNKAPAPSVLLQQLEHETKELYELILSRMTK